MILLAASPPAGEHIGSEGMHDDGRAGLRGDLGGVADVIVMGMPDQNGVCSLDLVEPKAQRAHPRAAVIEGVEQKNPVTEGQLVVCCSEPADRQDIRDLD